MINRRLYAVGGYDGVRRLDRWGLLIARIIIINKRLKMPGFRGKVCEGLNFSKLQMLFYFCKTVKNLTCVQ